MSKRQLPVISLFSGALGLDLGLEQAGYTIATAVECNRFAIQTIKQNRGDVPLIEEKIEDVPTGDILKKADLKVGEAVVLTGGPCCQSFSTAGQRGSVSDPRGSMFRQFVRVVNEARPRFFIMENVKGVLSAAVKHRPLKERGPGYPPLKPDEELGSAFRLILKELKSTGYHITFDVLNAADFGVPQTRERVIFVGSRDGEPVEMPEPIHAREPTGGLKPWVTLREALHGLEDPKPAYSELLESKKRYLKLIPAGGNWRDLPKRLHATALGGAYASWGGRGGFLRRLAWDRPAPALTTRPDSKATMLCHPRKLRPLSVAEYTRLQQFPDDWRFAGGVPQQYIQAGNAVPVGLGNAIGVALRKAMRRRAQEGLLGKVVCANSDLLDRMSRRPRTILNPARMRKVKTIEAAKKWLGDDDRFRQALFDLIDNDDEDEGQEKQDGKPKARR
jgi:DNA (cytosine-5)-methyltransferase 1